MFAKISLTALAGRHPDTSYKRYDTRDEDGTTTAKVLVKWCIRPAAYERGAEVWGAVEKAPKPYLIPADVELFEVKFLCKKKRFNFGTVEITSRS